MGLKTKRATVIIALNPTCKGFVRGRIAQSFCRLSRAPPPLFTWLDAQSSSMLSPMRLQSALIFCFFLVPGTSLWAFANAGVRPDPLQACSYLAPNPCAQVQFTRAPDTVSDNPFTLIFSSTATQPIQDLRVDLWSDQLGPAPTLSVQEISPGRYQIRQAFFASEGSWRIRVRFQIGNAMHKLQFPFTVSSGLRIDQ